MLGAAPDRRPSPHRVGFFIGQYECKKEIPEPVVDLPRGRRFFVEEEGTMSTFEGLSEVVSSQGLFCALYADRASHYWHTPEAD